MSQATSSRPYNIGPPIASVTSTYIPPLHPLKDKPFGPPKSAAVVAKMEHNTTSSTLSRTVNSKTIPAEVRLRIFTYVLGTNKIFIRHNPDPRIRRPIIYGDRSKDYLNLLRVCRAIYSEAYPIFLSKNTFSFDHPTTFKLFMENRYAHQRGLIGRLRLELKFSNRAGNTGYRGEEPRVWAETLSYDNVKSLTGLRYLSVHIRHLRYVRPTDTREYKVEDLMSGTFDAVRRFNDMGIRDVRMEVVSMLMVMVWEDNKLVWAEAEVKRLERQAREVRQRLLETNKVQAEGEK